jgi:hypothetical protein
MNFECLKKKKKKKKKKRRRKKRTTGESTTLYRACLNLLTFSKVDKMAYKSSN